jgi:hypothetical protein
MIYRLGADGRPSHAAEDSGKLTVLLKECREQRFHDSPLYQLIDGITPFSVPSDKTDGIVNLSGRGMLVVSVARQLGLGSSFARLICCPAQAERGRKNAPWVR